MDKRAPVDNRAHGLAGLSRHYYIGEKYQKKMIVKFCLLAAAGSTASCALFYFMLDRKIDGGYGQALEGMRFVKHTLMRDAIYIDLAVILLVTVAVIILTLLMSHRIAGPTWRMEQSAKAVGSGDLTLSVRLRQTDEMKPLADKMNVMVSGLRGKVDEIAQEFDLLECEIALLKERWKTEDLAPEATLELTAEICERSGALLSKLKGIKTDPSE